MQTDEMMVENGVTAPISETIDAGQTGDETLVLEGKPREGIVFATLEETPEELSEPAAIEPVATAEEPLLPPVENRSFLQAEYAALAAEMPEGLPFDHLAAFPALGAFLLLREQGVSPRAAYQSLVTVLPNGESAGDLSHLRAAAPRVTAPAAPARLTRETLTEWRRLFPHLSDREIGELYRRTAPNN